MTRPARAAPPPRTGDDLDLDKLERMTLELKPGNYTVFAFELTDYVRELMTSAPRLISLACEAVALRAELAGAREREARREADWSGMHSYLIELAAASRRQQQHALGELIEHAAGVMAAYEQDRARAALGEGNDDH